MEYVRTCPNAPGGTGFFVIPGTETCLRLSGYVRADYSATQLSEVLSTNTRSQNIPSWFARGQLNVDARTATEYGTLRSYIRIEGQNTDGATAFRLVNAYIQFNGLTAGRISSFFDFWTGQLYGNAPLGSDTYNNMNVLAYTASFGPGFMATISLEDPSGRRTSSNTAPEFAYGGSRLPDLVGNIFVEQAWGKAQLSAALHQLHASTTVGTDDDFGWAVQGGLQIKTPMIAPGDALWLQASYSNGALDYVNIPGATRFSEIGVTGIADAYNVAGNVEKTAAWSVAGAFTHYWTPKLESNFQAVYGQVDVPTAVGLTGVQAASQGVTDYSYWQLGTNLIWYPVNGLRIGGEVSYTAINTDAQFTPLEVGSAPTDDDGIWAGRLRIQRDF